MGDTYTCSIWTVKQGEEDGFHKGNYSAPYPLRRKGFPSTALVIDSSRLIPCFLAVLT